MNSYLCSLDGDSIDQKVDNTFMPTGAIQQTTWSCSMKKTRQLNTALEDKNSCEDEYKDEEVTLDCRQPSIRY